MQRKREFIETFKVKVNGLLDDSRDLLGDIIDSGESPILNLNIDATHSGRLTNNRVYPGVIVRDSVRSFIKPKGKPVLKNHDSLNDPIGRVVGAEFIQIKHGKSFENDFKRPSNGIGSGVIKLDLEIMDSDSIDKFIDKRFQEFSTRQTFNGLFCSLCGNDFSKDFCGHFPGETVTVESKSGKDREFKIFAITGPLDYLEVSVVNIAADKFTGINEMKVIQDSSDNDWIFSFQDNLEHDISNLTLTSSASESAVNLLTSEGKLSVSAKDRENLTGKTIISVTGPGFEDKHINFMKKNNKEEVKDKDVEDLEKTKKNTVVDDSNKESNDSKSNQDSTEEDKGEGVVAPKVNTEHKTDETTVSDKDVANASLKALTSVNQGLEDSNKKLILEIERVKGELVTKDEDIKRLRDSAVEAQTKLKESTAKQLLDNKLILGKPDVCMVKDTESYNKKLSDLSKRSLESLNDALEDLTPELVQYRGSKGVTNFSTKEVKNPVVNLEPDNSDKDNSKNDVKLSPQEVRRNILESHL